MTYFLYLIRSEIRVHIYEYLIHNTHFLHCNKIIYKYDYSLYFSDFPHFILININSFKSNLILICVVKFLMDTNVMKYKTISINLML